MYLKKIKNRHMMSGEHEVLLDMDYSPQSSTDAGQSSLHTEEQSHEICDTHQELSGQSPKLSTCRYPERECNTPKQYVCTVQDNAQIDIPSLNVAIESDQCVGWIRAIKEELSLSIVMIYGMSLQWQKVKLLFRAS